jgi:hypothetical protein
MDTKQDTIQGYKNNKPLIYNYIMGYLCSATNNEAV